MWTLREYSMWEVPPRQCTGPWQPGWHPGTPEGSTTQRHPAAAELCPWTHCQPAWSRGADIPWDSWQAAISLCIQGKCCSLLVKLPVLKAARDTNASAAAVPVRVKSFAQPSSQHPWAEQRLQWQSLRVLSVSQASARSKSVPPTDYFQTMENAILKTTRWFSCCKK